MYSGCRCAISKLHAQRLAANLLAGQLAGKLAGKDWMRSSC
jgi:hypothetical protein